MSKFIAVKQRSYSLESLVLVAADKIVTIREYFYDKDQGTILTFVGGSELITCESTKDILAKLEG